MPTPILMPALSPTMEKGKLAKWLKKEGDTIKSGDILAEIETDKATMEVEAVDEGTLGKILIAEGTEDVPVNEPIAVILDEGESVSDIKATEKPATPKPAAPPPHPHPLPTRERGARHPHLRPLRLLPLHQPRRPRRMTAPASFPPPSPAGLPSRTASTCRASPAPARTDGSSSAMWKTPRPRVPPLPPRRRPRAPHRRPR